MGASTVRKEVSVLLARREGLEDGLLKFRGKMVKGSLFEIYTACRKGNCRCTKGKKHGPFLYMGTYVNGKKAQRYVGKAGDRQTVEGLRRYKSFQSKLEEARKINVRLNKLWNELKKDLLKK